MSLDNNYFSRSVNENTPGPLSKVGRGMLRVVLLFGSAAFALALIIIPILSEQANRKAAQSVLPDNVDRVMTGSIKRDGPPCVIATNGLPADTCN
ncbi:hypothetical protein AAIB41_08775 [Brucella sp. BE17]|uniref:hypothetical protein n=1 Tax=Brucella sp. BE17 TaxID=3142977 RepID=UPI0031B9E67F